MKRKNLILSVFFALSFSLMSMSGLEKGTPCADQWSADVDILMDYFGATFDEADAIATREFEKCLDETYGN